MIIFLNRKLYKNCRLILFCLMVVALLFSTGCSSVKKSKIIIYSDKNTNEGKPVCLVIKSVHSNEFRTDSYRKISEAAYTTPVDNTILDRVMLIPGKKKKLKVIRPDKESLGLYCFFSEPDKWKLLLQRPLKSKYIIKIRENSIKIKEGGFFKSLNPFSDDED